MRKRIIDGERPETTIPEGSWLNLEEIARAEISAEDPEHPIEQAFTPDPDRGWRAGRAGEQVIRLLFDKPLRLQRILLRFDEKERSRTQEFVLHWSGDGGRSWNEQVRQQYNFNPDSATCELEDYRVNLDGVSALQLTIRPDMGGGPAQAALTWLLLA